MNYNSERDFDTSRHINEVLVRKILSGDTTSFGLIIKNTEGLVTQIIYRMINNAEDRKDIAQDVYFKAFKNLSDFKFQSKLSTWVGRITYNTCLNFLEKKKLVLSDTIFDANRSDEETLENSSTGMALNNKGEDLMVTKELTKILQGEIEKLPPVYKTLITLFHNEELSYAEISEITALPEGTLKNYLFRARKALKGSLLTNYKKEDL